MKLNLTLEHEQMYDLYNYIKFEIDDRKIAEIRKEVFKVLEAHRELKEHTVNTLAF